MAKFFYQKTFAEHLSRSFNECVLLVREGESATDKLPHNNTNNISCDVVGIFCRTLVVALL